MTTYTLVVQPPVTLTVVLGPEASHATVLSSPQAVQSTVSPPAEIRSVLPAMQATTTVVNPPSTTNTVIQVGQGPSGPSALGVPILGQTLVMAGPVLDSVLLYSDAEKTTLVERRKLYYSIEGRLSWVESLDSVGALVSTKTLQYVDGTLVGTVTT